MWEIREGYDRDYRMGRKDKSVEEAYECGYEDGYEAAMEELGERKSSSSYRGGEAGYRGGESGYRRRR